MKVDYSIFSKDFRNQKDFKNEYFGTLTIQWSVENLKHFKLLRYKLDDYDEVFEVNFNELQKTKMPLEEYFKSCIKLLHRQVMDYKESEKFRNLIKDDIKSVSFIKHFEEKFDKFHTGKK